MKCSSCVYKNEIKKTSQMRPPTKNINDLFIFINNRFDQVVLQTNSENENQIDAMYYFISF